MKTILLSILLAGLVFSVNADPIAKLIGPSTSGTIPANSRSWSFTVISGSATFSGNYFTAITLPSGFSDSDNSGTLFAPLILTAGPSSSVYIRYCY